MINGDHYVSVRVAQACTVHVVLWWHIRQFDKEMEMAEKKISLFEWMNMCLEAKAAKDEKKLEELKESAEEASKLIRALELEKLTADQKDVLEAFLKTFKLSDPKPDSKTDSGEEESDSKTDSGQEKPGSIPPGAGGGGTGGPPVKEESSEGGGLRNPLPFNPLWLLLALVLLALLVGGVSKLLSSGAEGSTPPTPVVKTGGDGGSSLPVVDIAQEEADAQRYVEQIKGLHGKYPEIFGDSPRTAEGMGAGDVSCSENPSDPGCLLTDEELKEIFGD